MSPAGVQGASAFKVAALGSHSSPPPPLFFLCTFPLDSHCVKIVLRIKPTFLSWLNGISIMTEQDCPLNIFNPRILPFR